MTSTAGTTTACSTSKAAAAPRPSSCLKKPSRHIYHAIKRDALLENVTVLADGSIDFNDGSKTENTRVSYPIHHIQNIVAGVQGGSRHQGDLPGPPMPSACCRRYQV